MIVRIFQVTIRPELRNEFEKDFETISVEAVKHQKGFIKCEIGHPTKWNPNEYSMITYWKDEPSLVAFAGEKWNMAVIPHEMENYPIAYNVVHYRINE